jgi:4-oxalocrotonate tautomerase
MPHVIVKMHAGRSEEQKARLAQEVTRAVMSALGSSERSISVAVEDVEPADWVARVYKPDILAKPGSIYKKPGYDPT